jgi:phosphate transport system permease protein
MSNKRKRNDLILQTLTYAASFFSIITLFSIVFFVLTNGLKLLNLDLIRNNYESQNVIAEVNDNDLLCDCVRPVDLPETVYYSSRYGLGLIDSIDLMGKNQVEVFYVHPDSPLNDLINKGVDDAPLALDEGDSVLRIAYSDSPSSLSRYGAAQMILELDAATGFRELEYTIPGGGIRGSIITTLYLIVFTLLIALPMGVGVAIYLNEYAKNNRFTRLIRSLVELLTGVPSIIYGLMGLAFFVPFIIRITSATSGSILSGAMTLAVILLPVIIRTTEESLKVVPDEYRMASLSLGASKTQTTFKIVLPSAFQGILTSTLLAIGRIIGESAALVFAIGTSIKDDIQLTHASTSLAVHIWAMMTDEPANIELSSTIALIILFIVLLLNLTIKLFSRRFLKKVGDFG